jgi:hypothetical protein
MSVSYSVSTGGWVTAPAAQNGNAAVSPAARQPYVSFDFMFPDTFAGQSVTFSGVYLPVNADLGSLAAPINLAASGGGNTIALPAVPGGGQSTIWGLQISAAGVVSLKSNTGATGAVANPAPDAGNVMMFVHTITNGDTLPWMRAPSITDLN